MNEVDNIRSDSYAEDGREDEVGSGFLNDGFSGLDVGIVDVYNLSVDHGDK